MLALVLPSSFTEHVNPSSSISFEIFGKSWSIPTLLAIPQPDSTPTLLSTLPRLMWFQECSLAKSPQVWFARAALNLGHQEWNTIFQLWSDNSIRFKKILIEYLLYSRLIFFLILTILLLTHPKNTLGLF